MIWIWKVSEKHFSSVMLGIQNSAVFRYVHLQCRHWHILNARKCVYQLLSGEMKCFHLRQTCKCVLFMKENKDSSTLLKIMLESEGHFTGQNSVFQYDWNLRTNFWNSGFIKILFPQYAFSHSLLPVWNQSSSHLYKLTQCLCSNGWKFGKG